MTLRIIQLYIKKDIIQHISLIKLIPIGFHHSSTRIQLSDALTIAPLSKLVVSHFWFASLLVVGSVGAISAWAIALKVKSSVSYHQLRETFFVESSDSYNGTYLHSDDYLLIFTSFHLLFRENYIFFLN